MFACTPENKSDKSNYVNLRFGLRFAIAAPQANETLLLLSLGECFIYVNVMSFNLWEATPVHSLTS